MSSERHHLCATLRLTFVAQQISQDFNLLHYYQSALQKSLCPIPIAFQQFFCIKHAATFTA